LCRLYSGELELEIDELWRFLLFLRFLTSGELSVSLLLFEYLRLLFFFLSLEFELDLFLFFSFSALSLFSIFLTGESSRKEASGS